MFRRRYIIINQNALLIFILKLFLPGFWRLENLNIIIIKVLPHLFGSLEVVLWTGAVLKLLVNKIAGLDRGLMNQIRLSVLAWSSLIVGRGDRIRHYWGRRTLDGFSSLIDTYLRYLGNGITMRANCRWEVWGFCW